MATNNFKAFATGDGANVTTQTDYEALASLLSGFSSGKASSAQINKALRQGTVMAAMLGAFLNSQGLDAKDDGNLSNLLTNFNDALTNLSDPRYLSKSNNLSEIQNAGANAQSSARGSLGLGSAAQRAIGTGTNQVPDMSSFGSLISSAGYQKLPGGLIIQWGMINGTTGQLSGVYPTAFPNAVLQAVVSLSDKTSGANAGISVFVEAATFTSKTALTVQARGTDGSGTTSARFIAIGW